MWWGPLGSLMAGAAPLGAGLSWPAGACRRSGKDGWGEAGLCSVGRALSSCSRPGGAAEMNAGGGILIRNNGRPHCCSGEWRGGAGRGEAAGEGRPGRCGAGHARLAWRNGETQRQWRQGRGVLVGGGGTVRRGPGRGGVAGWGVPGLHKASRISSAGGIALFPPQQPSSEQPPGVAGWAAAGRVTAAEILLSRR